MIEALGLLASFLKMSLRTELQQQGHSTTGKLSESIDVVVEQTVTGFEITGQAVYYAKFVNDGRKAGVKGVPIEALIEWVRQRKINIQGLKEKSIAFMFQSSIKEKGIKPSLFITKTLDESTNAIDERITDAMSQMVDTYIEEMFNSINAA